VRVGTTVPGIRCGGTVVVIRGKSVSVREREKGEYRDYALFPWFCSTGAWIINQPVRAQERFYWVESLF
jgi:hypothetical protein